MTNEINDLLEQGYNESEICKKLSITHLTLRKECYRNNLPLFFKYIPYSLTVEACNLYEDEDNDYTPAQLAKMYSVKQSVLRQMLYSEYFSTSASPYVKRKLIEDCIAKGFNFKQTVEAIPNCSAYRLRDALNRYGLSIKNKHPRLTVESRELVIQKLKEGVPQHEIAGELGITPSAVSHIKRHTLGARQYNTADRDLVLQLRAEGYTQQEIASQLDVAQSTISRALDEY